MGLFSLLLSNPITFLILVVPLLYSVIFHEMAHGVVAYFFGDDTAKQMGRLSLNPMDHLDPMGTLALFLVGFGWAKPVPVNFSRLRPARLGLICVSLAGVATNILVATVSMFLLYKWEIPINTLGGAILLTMARINIILGAFNLIPLPPLDGSKILMGILPRDGQEAMAMLQPYGFFILVFLLFTGILDPVIDFFQHLILLLISMLLGFSG